MTMANETANKAKTGRAAVDWSAAGIPMRATKVVALAVTAHLGFAGLSEAQTAKQAPRKEGQSPSALASKFLAALKTSDPAAAVLLVFPNSTYASRLAKSLPI